MTFPAGYRCIECGSTGDIDAGWGGHAVGCGRPARDSEAQRQAWNEQLAEFIPKGDAKATHSYRMTYRWGVVPEAAADHERVAQLQAEAEAALDARLIPPRTVFVGPLAHESIRRMFAAAGVPVRDPLTLQTGLDGEWTIVADPDCPNDYHWPRDLPLTVANVVGPACAVNR
jgi:hypothetical protein